MTSPKFSFLSQEDAGTGAPDAPYIIHAKISESWVQGLSRVLLGALIGSLLTIFYSQYQKNRDDLNQQFAVRKDVIHSLSNFIFERRERAVLLASALKSGANLEDIRHRKRRYDETYVNWNKNMTVNLVSIKSIVPDAAYDLVKNFYEGTIDDLFGKADSCLTSAYNTHFDGAPEAPTRSKTMITNCNAFAALKVLKGCGSETIWTIDVLARKNLEDLRETFLNPTSLQFWGFKPKKAREQTTKLLASSKNPSTSENGSLVKVRHKLEQKCLLAPTKVTMQGS